MKRQTILNGKKGFSLIELLAVIVIILILFGILMSALFKAGTAARRKLALTTVSVLTTAIRNYKTEFSSYPCLPAGRGSDWGRTNKTYSADNWYVIAALTSAVPPMLNMSGFQVNSNGTAVDPWLSPYIIELDTDEDNDIDGGVRVRCVNLP